MVYGAFAALAQTDFKRMVAYSSVSHMGYVMLGLGVWSAVGGQEYRWDFWAQGVNGRCFKCLPTESAPQVCFYGGRAL